MGIFSRKKAKAITPHIFTEDERELSAQRRKMSAEKKRIYEQIELEKAKADLEITKRELADMLMPHTEHEGGTMEDKVMLKLLDTVMAVKNKPQTEVPTDDEVPLQNMSDDEIREFLKQFTKAQMKMALALPDSVLRSKIMEMMPVDDDTVDRAMIILRS